MTVEMAPRPTALSGEFGLTKPAPGLTLVCWMMTKFQTAKAAPAKAQAKMKTSTAAICVDTWLDTYLARGWPAVSAGRRARAASQGAAAAS